MVNISKFIETTHPSAPTLGSFLGTVSGITILNHSIERPTLPTWHSFPTNNLKSSANIITDSVYASKIHFCDAARTYSGTLPYPAEPTLFEPNLYLVDHKKYSPKTDPVTFLAFTPKDHSTPDVFWFHPYTRGTGELNHSLVMGLKIEVGEIDGVSIPIPNPSLNLINQNSEYRQGSIPSNLIIPTFNLNGTERIRIRTRVLHEDHEPLSFNRRSISKNVFPSFADSAISRTVNGTFPYTLEKGHQNFEVATTYCQWNASQPCPHLQA